MSLKKVVLASLLIDSKPGFASGDDLEEGVFQIRMNNITRDGTLDIAKRRRVSVDEKKLCSVLLNVDDVLFNATNSPDLVGKSAYIGNLDEPTTYSNHFVRLRSDPEKLDGSYLARWLHTLFQAGKFKGLCKQWVNQATVSRDSLLALEIPLPSLPEQRRIAAILDQAETLRTQRRTALALLDSLTQSLFLDMFGDGLTNPHDWPTKSIDSVCELVVDCVNRTAPVVEEPTPYKMIRTTNVKGGNVDLSSARYVSAETFKDWNRRATPRRGDVLLTREAPVGEAGILATNDNVFLGQRLMLYRPALNRLTSEYLLYSFMSPYLQLQFNRHGAGSTVKHLPLPACRAFELRIPPFPLQQTFATRIASIEALKATHRHALAALDALFASLQQRAFSGELTLAAPRASAQSLDQLQQLEASIGQEALIFIAKRMPDGDLYNSLKAIYFADRHHLEHYGYQIYNETYCALPHGPVPQSAYDATRVLIGERMFSDFDDDAMRAALRRNDKKLTALRDADFSKLSRSVVESLEWAVRYCSDMKFGQTKTASHDSAYERTPKNEVIPLKYIIDTLPPEARQRHWNL